MKTRVGLGDPVICYLVFVTCATIFVATTAVNPATIVNVSFKENRNLLKQTVARDEETRQRGELRRESPFWITSTGDRITAKSFEKSKESTTEGTILFSTDKCSRYCIEKDTDKNEDQFQYINLFWSANGTDIMDYFLPEGHTQLITPEWTAGETSNNVLRKCQIYLDLDCNTLEAGIATNSMKKFNPDTQIDKDEEDVSDRSDKPNFPALKKMAERCNLSDHTETKFMVSDATHEIVIDVDGNVSNAVLRMPTNATVPWSGTAISWTRKTNADGVRINTRNAPSGEWSVKLTGEENSKYHITVEEIRKENDEREEKSFFSRQTNDKTNAVPITEFQSGINAENNASFDDNETSNDLPKTTRSNVTSIEQQHLNRTVDLESNEYERISRERSSEGDSFVREQNHETAVENSNNDDSSMTSFTKENEQQEIRARSSVGWTENMAVEDETAVASNVSMSLKLMETSGNQELSEELVNYANENTIEERRMLIDVNRNSNLLVTPGTIHRVVFDVTNSCVLPVRYAFRVKSTPFRIYNVQPTYAWIYPGQMSNVAVDLIIPDNTTPDTSNTVTLFIQGTEIKEKSAYLYVQGSLSKLTDDVKPTIEYSFNNNCAGKLGKDRCYKSRWSVDIKIQDYDSGLKRVISSPNEGYPRTEFISGTRSPITFYYSATCCDTTAKITAVDLLDNYNTYTIDVTAWNNLSEAEIAAITVGAFLGLLLIILIIISIIYCIRRRKSHDLPYTQRYGSRPPVHAERSNL